MTPSIDHTPNPRTKKFTISYGNPDYSRASTVTELSNSPFSKHARAITDIFVGGNYLSITLHRAEDWSTLRIPFEETISESKLEIIEWINGLPQDRDQIVPSDIQSVLDNHIRPALKHDGGDVSFISFEDGILTLKMKGACSTCPSSLATLKLGVLNVMRHFIPSVRDVVAGN